MTTQLAQETPTPTAWITGHQFISGLWRDGNSSTVLNVTNPFNGDDLVAIRQADAADLDDDDLVVDDFLADIDGRGKFLEREIDDVDGAADAGAETAGRYEKGLHEFTTRKNSS